MPRFLWSIMKDRIYVCHTFYHVYVTFLKEFKLREEMKGEPFGGATLVLSKMSNNFGELKKRIEALSFFEEVIEFDEKRDTFFPELAPFKEDKGNIVKNLISRMKFTKLYAKAEAQYVPVDFKQYGDVYVYCDADPIGIYLNKNHIHYHALEDGLNSLAYIDAARVTNKGHFGLKAFLSRSLNLIFVENGYGKYCLDMEVDNIGAIKYPCKQYIEEPRKALTKRLTTSEIDLLLSAFVKDKEKMDAKIQEVNDKGGAVLLLTGPYCDLETRKKMFTDIVNEYEGEYAVFIKPHPRDVLNYDELFPSLPKFEASVPMEMLNFYPNLHFKKALGILTEMAGITCADECLRLGPDFLDKYEEPSIHRQNEAI